MKKLFTAVLAASFCLGATGCFGSFNLTKKAYNFNKSLGDKWIQWLVFLVAGHFVGGITLAVDALVLNSIEFWTGSNPVSAGNTLEQTDEQGNKLIATKLPGGALDLTLVRVDGSIEQMSLVNTGETVLAYDKNGQSVGVIPMQESAAAH